MGIANPGLLMLHSKLEASLGYSEIVMPPLPPKKKSRKKEHVSKEM